MKKILLAIIVALSSIGANAQQFSASFTGITATNYTILTNRASVYSITLSGANAGTVTLYDMDTTNAPFYGVFYTNAPYYSFSTYSTNLVTSYVGYNGYTNWYTNAGLYTLSNYYTANTNSLPIMWQGSVPSGGVSTYNVDLTFARGVSANFTTNNTIMLQYRSGR